MTGDRSTPRLVAFDWGGVILRHCRSWSEGCAAAGLPHYDDIHTPEQIAARKNLHADFQRGICSPDEFLSRLATHAQGRYSVDELRQLHDRWLLDEYAGVGTLIDALHAAGVETALLSNTNHLHWIRHLPIEEGGTGDYPTARKLMHRHASHLLGHAKPDAEIYAAFEAATGFAGPEILFFDDLAENCEAAAAFGWHTCRVDHTTETAPQITAALRAHRIL